MTLNLDKCIDQLTKCELLSENTIKDLCQHMREAMIYEPNVQNIKAPVTVVGDINGYFLFSLTYLLFLMFIILLYSHVIIFLIILFYIKQTLFLFHLKPRLCILWYK